MLRKLLLLFITSTLLVSCSGKTLPMHNKTNHYRVLAVESFIADIAQNVAGDRITVESPHPARCGPAWI